MQLTQISYFLHLAATLNFTTASERSGISQPSLTRAIQRLEEELGGQLITRDGKNSRLTPLGEEAETEFRRVDIALRCIRRRAERRAAGQPNTLDIAVADGIGAKIIFPLLDTMLSRLPSTAINLTQISASTAADAVRAGRIHACILPQMPGDTRHLSILPLLREPLLLGCAKDHPLANREAVKIQDIAKYPYVDRLACEFRRDVYDHFAAHDVLLHPRFRAEREDVVQYVVMQSRGFCILPEHSVALHGLVTRPISGLTLARHLLFVTMCDLSSNPDVSALATLASRHEWRFTE